MPPNVAATRFLHLFSPLFIALALPLAFNLTAANPPAFSLRESEIVLRQVDLESGLQRDSLGYPRIDPARVDLNKIIKKSHRAVILENRYLRVLVLPEMGRIFSLFDKTSQHEQLWTNQIARPLFQQQNELGWWMVWGGVEYTIPAGEHGTTWALPWRYQITENSAARKAVRMQVLEPKTQLEQTVEISLAPDTARFQSEITIRNISSQTARFSHWVNPMWAPGGRGQLTPKTEFIVPTRQMLVAHRDFNNWMLGDRIQPWAANPLRFAENWRDLGDLLAVQLTHGFYSAYCHEADEGVARVFDHHLNPGMDIWTWGFPPPLQRQKEYSLTPNLGYVEMWGGNTRDFSEAALQPIAPGETVRFVEWMYPYRQTQGLTLATRDLALNFQFSDEAATELDLALCAVAPLGKVTLALADSNGKRWWKKTVRLTPESTFRITLPIPAKFQGPVEFIATRKGEVLARAHAQPAPAIHWGGPFLPKQP